MVTDNVYRECIGMVLALLFCLYARNLPAQTPVISMASSQAASKAFIILHTNATVSEIAKEITQAVAAYGELTPQQLLKNPDFKKRETKGTSEVITLERKTGISERFVVNGGQITSFRITDMNQNAYTINYLSRKDGCHLANFSQALRGKAEGPYVEWHDSGKVRTLAWFRDGKMAKIEIWDESGKLTDSKVFPAPVEIKAAR